MNYKGDTWSWGGQHKLSGRTGFPRKMCSPGKFCWPTDFLLQRLLLVWPTLLCASEAHKRVGHARLGCYHLCYHIGIADFYDLPQNKQLIRHINVALQ